LALAAEPFVAVHRGKQAGGERRGDALEELQEDEADRVAVRKFRWYPSGKKKFL
jgi:hypothetical protein